MSNLFGCDPVITEHASDGIKTKWNYIAEYIVDARNSDDMEVLESACIPVSGDMDSECYYSECMGEALMEDYLPDSIRDEPGVYRLVFGVKTKGSECWTDCGYEYDAWEDYDLLFQYKFTDEEVKVCWDDPERITI